MEEKILDEMTGLFKSSVKFNESGFQFHQGMVLNEFTGHFEPQNCNSSSDNFESDFEYSGSSYYPSSGSSSSENEEAFLGTSLDEQSGNLIKNRRKKGQSKPETWEKNRIKKISTRRKRIF